MFFPNENEDSQDRMLQKVTNNLSECIVNGHSDLLEYGDDRPVDLLSKLSDVKYDIERNARASQKPSAIGVFGPSQVGKSYLIDQLVKDDPDPAQGVLIDVAGGILFTGQNGVNTNTGASAESTGVVCRFTSHRIGQSTDRFVAKLISHKDLLLSMVNGFVQECNPSAINVDDLLGKIKQFPNDDGNDRTPFWQMIDEILKYIQNNHSDNGYYARLLGEHGIRAVFNNITTCSRSQELMVASVFWGGIVGLNELYEKLMGELSRIGSADYISIPVDCVTNTLDGSKRLVHVDNYKRIMTDDNDHEITVYDRQGQSRSANITKPVLCALISELILPIKQDENRQNSNNILSRGDVLDFPGYTPPNDVNRFGPRDLTPGEDGNSEIIYDRIGKVLTRGKLTHLFEHYCAEREISTLLLCLENNNFDAGYLPIQVEKWLATRYSEFDDIDNPALFIAITKFDQLLNAEGPEDEKRWNTLFNGIKVFLGRYERAICRWFNKWPYASGAGQFKNIYFVRNPGCTPANTGNIDAIREGYRKFNEDDEGNYKYIGTGCNSWDAAAYGIEYENTEGAKVEYHGAGGDGGVTFMKEQLCVSFNPDNKRIELKEALEKVHTDAIAALKTSYDDGAISLESRQGAKRMEAKELLDKIKREPTLFPQIIEGLELTIEVIDEAYRQLGEPTTIEKFLDKVSDLWGKKIRNHFDLRTNDVECDDIITQVNQLAGVLRKMIKEQLCPKIKKQLNGHPIGGLIFDGDKRNLVKRVIAIKWNDYILKSGVSFNFIDNNMGAVPEVQSDDRAYSRYALHWSNEIEQLYIGSLGGEPPCYNSKAGNLLEELKNMAPTIGGLYPDLVQAEGVNLSGI